MSIREEWSIEDRSEARPAATGAAWRRPSAILLWLLYGFTLLSVAGYWLFGLHPGRLPDSDLARSVFIVAFEAFARLHIAVAAIVLSAMLVWRLRLRWIGPFALVCGLAFIAEHVGTGYGIPFGGYAYSGLLGIKIGGRVPALIPVSWFLMTLPSWVLANAALGGPNARTARVALAPLLLLAWDLALDPAMSFLTPYWSWEGSGPYYGMPWLNLLGWYLTGLLLTATLEAFAARAGWADLSPGWMGAYYAAMLLMPLGMLIAAGAWAAVLTTALAVGAVGAVSLALVSRSLERARGPLPVAATEAW